MITALIFATPDRELYDYARSANLKIVPLDLLRRHPYVSRMKIYTYVRLVLPSENVESLSDYVMDVSFDADCALVLLDGRLNAPRAFLDAFFVRKVEISECGAHLQNFFNKACARMLKEFSAYGARFDDGKMQKRLLLPLRNFRAAEMSKLRNIFNGSFGSDSIHDELSGVLSEIGDRLTPKKQTDKPRVYFKDDDARYFEYGHEQHSEPDTASPHTILCHASSGFRFGKRITGKRHFNVTQERGTTISGKFPNCHDAVVTHGPTSHVNLFPNDFSEP